MDIPRATSTASSNQTPNAMTTIDDETLLAEKLAAPPAMTAAEQARFEKIFPKDAKRKIAAYLAWRQAHDLDEASASASLPSAHTHDDAQLWHWAWHKSWAFHHCQEASLPNTGHAETAVSKSQRRSSRKSKQHQARDSAAAAAAAAEQDTLSSSASSTQSTNAVPSLPPTVPLPQVVYCHCTSNAPNNDDKTFLCDKQGHTLLHVLAARLDPTKAGKHAHDLYATSLALYLDRYLNNHRQQQSGGNDDYDNDDTHKHRVTLLLDVRAGVGWNNPPALELVGLVRHLATSLHDLYPDCLHKCLLFPVPRPAIFIWNMCRGLLDESIRNTVCLLPGGALAESPAPIKDLAAHVDEAALQHCEQVRLETFQ